MELIGKIKKRYAYEVDKTQIYFKQRWLFTIFLYIIYVIRCYLYGYYAVTYFACLYILFATVQFLTPAGLPDPDDDNFDLPRCTINQSDTNDLHFKNDQERPLLRKLPEFKFWKLLTSIGIVVVILTFIKCLNIHIYWPFLFLYVVALIGCSIIKHFKHMKKYGYSIRDFMRKGLRQ